MEHHSVNNIMSEIRNVETGVNSTLIPILKDTIGDYREAFKKMFIIVLAQIVAILLIVTYCAMLFSKSNERYTQFIDKIEFEKAVVEENET